MAKRIRVIVTEVYEYEPDFAKDFAYLEHGITTVEEAFELDKRDCTAGKTSPSELSYNPPQVSMEWSVVDDPT